jgi:SpoVK/Ycf46/Vps4 family AAA+-type ATPase
MVYVAPILSLYVEFRFSLILLADPLDIDSVQDIPSVKDGDQDGFERLILPLGHKEIVRALVKTHAVTADSSPFNGGSQREFDVVRGKGKGLIILLHGSPGVGKTSTAECVAANAGRPLFPITCGDLGGNTAQEVEKNLEKFFDLARKWNCVLLLDEADVFLSARGYDIRQNSLVSGMTP